MVLAANLSFAALQLMDDLHFSHSVYGLGAGEELSPPVCHPLKKPPVLRTVLCLLWGSKQTTVGSNVRPHAGTFFLGYMVLQVPSPLVCARSDPPGLARLSGNGSCCSWILLAVCTAAPALAALWTYRKPAKQ